MSDATTYTRPPSPEAGVLVLVLVLLAALTLALGAQTVHRSCDAYLFATRGDTTMYEVHCVKPAVFLLAK